MSPNEIAVSRKLVYGVSVTLGIILLLLLFGGKLSAFGFGRSQNAASAVDDTRLAAGSAEKFAYLSGQGEQRSVGST